jgi:hypothetical protein
MFDYMFTLEEVDELVSRIDEIRERNYLIYPTTDRPYNIWDFWAKEVDPYLPTTKSAIMILHKKTPSTFVKIKKS